MDSGATHLYIAPNAPHGPLDTSASRIRVVTANGQVEISTAKATLPIPQLAADFPTMGYIMPTFTNTLIGIGPICDANCIVVFKKQDFTVISPEGNPILQGWREKKLPCLWGFVLKPNGRGEQKYTTTNQRGPEAHSVYDLPIVEALFRYMHAAAGFLVKSTWLKVIKNGNFESWPGLTYNNALIFFPHSVETLKGHPILQGWREKKLPCLWGFVLKPNGRGEQKYTTTNQRGPEAHSVYDLPIVEALFRYMHAAAGFLVKSTWLKVIKNGNFESWPGLTYNNALIFFPHSVETLKGHMVQSSQGVRSTKKKKNQKDNNKKKPPQGKIQQQSDTADIP